MKVPGTAVEDNHFIATTDGLQEEIDDDSGQE